MMEWEEDKKAKAFERLHDGVCQSPKACPVCSARRAPAPTSPWRPLFINCSEANRFRRVAEPHISPSSQDDIIEFVAALDRQSEYSHLFRAMESQTQAI
jgi:hypothetical protein